MSEQATGSCLCGAVKYIVRGSIKAVANCHCKTCQKITGAVFGTIAVIGEDDLQFIEGQELLSAYPISEKATKYFCRTCGTPVYNTHTRYPGNYMTQVGSFDNPALAQPAINIFCRSMMPWLPKIAELKCFDNEPTR